MKLEKLAHFQSELTFLVKSSAGVEYTGKIESCFLRERIETTLTIVEKLQKYAIIILYFTK